MYSFSDKRTYCLAAILTVRAHPVKMVVTVWRSGLTTTVSVPTHWLSQGNTARQVTGSDLCVWKEVTCVWQEVTCVTGSDRCLTGSDLCVCQEVTCECVRKWPVSDGKWTVNVNAPPLKFYILGLCCRMLGHLLDCCLDWLCQYSRHIIIITKFLLYHCAILPVHQRICKCFALHNPICGSAWSQFFLLPRGQFHEQT